jgi:hypothetical protein
MAMCWLKEYALLKIKVLGHSRWMRSWYETTFGSTFKLFKPSKAKWNYETFQIVLQIGQSMFGLP